MSATIQQFRLSGVTQNSLHYLNNRLIINSLQINKKLVGTDEDVPEKLYSFIKGLANFPVSNNESTKSLTVKSSTQLITKNNINVYLPIPNVNFNSVNEEFTDYRLDFYKPKQGRQSVDNGDGFIVDKDVFDFLKLLEKQFNSDYIKTINTTGAVETSSQELGSIFVNGISTGNGIINYNQDGSVEQQKSFTLVGKLEKNNFYVTDIFNEEFNEPENLVFDLPIYNGAYVQPTVNSILSELTSSHQLEGFGSFTDFPEAFENKTLLLQPDDGLDQKVQINGSLSVYKVFVGSKLSYKDWQKQNQITVKINDTEGNELTTTVFRKLYTNQEITIRNNNQGLLFFDVDYSDNKSVSTVL